MVHKPACGRLLYSCRQSPVDSVNARHTASQHYLAAASIRLSDVLSRGTRIRLLATHCQDDLRDPSQSGDSKQHILLENTVLNLLTHCKPSLKVVLLNWMHANKQKYKNN